MRGVGLDIHRVFAVAALPDNGSGHLARWTLPPACLAR
jgi:hypothetical protein